MKNSNLPKYKKCTGFKSPNYTNVPDEFLDFYVPYLSESELKVSLYIIRRTFGFKKEADSISLSQLENGIVTKDGRVLDYGTGLSRPSIVNAIKGLLEKGIIEAEKSKSQNGGNATTTYRLHMNDRDDGVVKNFNHPSKNSLPGVVKNFNPQETVLQKTVLYSNSKYSKNGMNKNESRGGGLKSVKSIIQDQSRVSLKRDTDPLEQPKLPGVGNLPISKTGLPYKPSQSLTEVESLTIQFSNELGDSQNIKSNLTEAWS
jgi:hypothetical protein